MKVIVDVPNTDAAQRLVTLLRRIGHEARLDESTAGATYTVKLERWDQMSRKLLRQITDEVGSIRRAAKLLGLPRSTLGSWLKPGGQPRARPASAESEQPPAYTEF